MHWTIAEAKEWLDKPGIANAFGLILHTDRHVHTGKVLNDPDFWKGLDERTGDRWPVFVLKGAPGKLEKPPAKPGSLDLLVPIWKEPNENRKILEELALRSTQDPYLLVYSVLTDDTVLYHTVKLSEESFEAAYDALKEALDAATTAIEDLHEANLKSAEGVNAALDLTLTHLKDWKRVRKGISLYGMLKKILGMVTGAG
jgi:hypothetical protein